MEPECKKAQGAVTGVWDWLGPRPSWSMRGEQIGCGRDREGAGRSCEFRPLGLPLCWARVWLLPGSGLGHVTGWGPVLAGDPSSQPPVCPPFLGSHTVVLFASEGVAAQRGKGAGGPRAQEAEASASPWSGALLPARASCRGLPPLRGHLPDRLWGACV